MSHIVIVGGWYAFLYCLFLKQTCIYIFLHENVLIVIYEIVYKIYVESILPQGEFKLWNS